VLHVQAFPRSKDRTESRAAERSAPVAPRRGAEPPRTGGARAGRCPRCGFLYGMVSTPEGDHCNHCGAGPASPR
jgi:hypothetical protein